MILALLTDPFPLTLTLTLILQGFILSTLAPRLQPKLFPPPQAPKGFVSGHIFVEDIVSISGGGGGGGGSSSSSSIGINSRSNKNGSNNGSSSSGDLADKRRRGQGGAAASGALLGEPEIVTKS
jgi:hypothetical protein